VQEEEKKGGDNHNRNNRSHNKGGPKKGGKSHTPSTEEGFTGDSETWFDDIQFKKQIT
jgi:hypothetical protein